MNPRLIATAAGSFLAGGAVGYFVAYKRLSADFDKRLESETAEMRTFYTSVGKKKYPTPEAAVADLISEDPEAEAALKEYQAGDGTIMYNKVVKSSVKAKETLIDIPEGGEVVEPVVERNVFESKRDPNNPYIISQDEFMQNDPEHDQVTLTYYEKDHVLADERDDVIEDQAATTGLDAFVNFGIDSSDEHIVHVRNERLRMDFEICRNESSYAREVLAEEETQPELPSRRERGV